MAVDTTTGILIGGVSILVLGLLYLLFTDILSFLVMVTIAGIVVFTLYQLGYLTFSKKNGEVDITFQETSPAAPAPSHSSKSEPKPTSEGLPEVFYVSDNVFTYADAGAVCSAYGAELATYSQVEEAYMKGAEWCGYGWSKGGMALFPTQQHTWQSLQSEPELSRRTACGRPGINGGYFDPKTKFGVNCYGVKPGQPKRAINPQASKAFSDLVNRIKSQLGRLTVYGWDTKDWSEYSDEKKAVKAGESGIEDIQHDFGKLAGSVEKEFKKL
jgi:hypothetical protein